MNARNQFVSIMTFSLLTIMSQMVFAQIPNLDNASISLVADLSVERAVYDSSRNLIYGTVSSNSANGNSIAIIDPLTRGVSFVTGAGSDPNAIAISGDNSVVYFGVDGAGGFRSFNPQTLEFGTIQLLGTPQPTGTATAEDFAIQPGNPGTVIVSSDEIGNSGSGVLQTFSENGFVSSGSVFEVANSIEFLDSDTLIGFDNSNDGFGLTRFAFDGFNPPVPEIEIGGLVRGFATTIEVVGGTVFGTDGTQVNPETLAGLGSIDAANAIEPFTGNDVFEGGVTYTIGSSELTLFSNEFFQEIDSFEFGNSISTPVDLFFAGEGTLGVVGANGSLSLITGIPTSDPTSVPEPSSSILMLAVGFGLSCRRRKRSRRLGA